jgi:DNA-binding transcriptional regulator YiaG
MGTIHKESFMNIAQVLKAEISRIARREAKLLAAPIRKSTAKHRSDVASLKSRLAVMDQEIKRLNVLVVNLASTQAAPEVDSQNNKGWVSGKGVKALRRKTGLTQADFGKLTGVTAGAVRLWERNPGMLKLREATKAAIMAARGIGKNEARKRLEKIATNKALTKKPQTKLKATAARRKSKRAVK